MFPKWAVVIFYLISLVEFDAECNSTIMPVIPILKSEYDRLMVLRRNYWKVRCNHDLIVDHCKQMFRFDKNMQLDELKKCHQRLLRERQEFDKKLTQIKSEINSLTRYRYLSIVKNQIAEFDLYTIDFPLNMTVVHPLINPLRKGAQFEEIRRQRWDYLFEKRLDLPDIKYVVVELAQAGIHYKDFSKRIARGYEMLLNELQTVGLDDATALETMPDFNQTIIGDANIDKCLLILMKNYESRDSLYWKED